MRLRLGPRDHPAGHHAAVLDDDRIWGDDVLAYVIRQQLRTNLGLQKQSGDGDLETCACFLYARFVRSYSPVKA